MSNLGKPKHDETDLIIINILQENARTSLRKLSDKLGMSDVGAYYRIRKLSKEGVIKKFTILIDPEKLGLSIRVTIGIQVDPLLLDEVASKIAEEPSFYMVWTVSGAHNIHAEAAFRDNAEMKRVLEGMLHKIQGIQEYHMSVMLKPIKEDYSLSQKIISAQESQT